TGLEKPVVPQGNGNTSDGDSFRGEIQQRNFLPEGRWPGSSARGRSRRSRVDRCWSGVGRRSVNLCLRKADEEKGKNAERFHRWIGLKSVYAGGHGDASL